VGGGLGDPFANEKPAGYTARFEALRRWRLERARADSVPAFVVASDRTLDDIATMAPNTPEGLELCYGIGPHKAEAYGAAILDVLQRVAGPRPGERA
jgi:superfamily II DNA helicase RecQ